LIRETTLSDVGTTCGSGWFYFADSEMRSHHRINFDLHSGDAEC
jgi:hypothetical protein